MKHDVAHRAACEVLATQYATKSALMRGPFFPSRRGPGRWKPGYETTAEPCFAGHSADEFRPLLEDDDFIVDAVSTARGSKDSSMTFEARGGGLGAQFGIKL